jgi:HEAT repeat protein
MKTLRNILLIVSICMLLALGWVMYQGASYFYWWSWATNPSASVQLKEHLRTFSSEKLLGMTWSASRYNPYPGTALAILAERKEKKIVPIFLKGMKSPDVYVRHSAMMALADIGDERAIEPLMEIVRKATIDYGYNGNLMPDYVVALMALSKMRYEPVYHYAIEFATSKVEPNNLKGYGVIMLGNFENPEALPILKQIAQEKNLPWYSEGNVKNAIKQIEAAQGQKK